VLRCVELPDDALLGEQCHVSALPDAIVAIYERTGRIILSEDALYRSAYYPFKERPSKAFLSTEVTFHFTTREKNGSLIVKAWSTTTPKSSTIQTFESESFPSLQYSKEMRSALLISSYISGIRKRQDQLRAIRDDFFEMYLQTINFAPYKNGPYPLVPFQLKIIPYDPILFGNIPANRGDLPATQEELTQYVNWLQETEGLKRLVDAWGKPLVFTMKKNIITCRSAGADGKIGTADDIIMSKPGNYRGNLGRPPK
jgi:hypothetical protein